MSVKRSYDKDFRDHVLKAVNKSPLSIAAVARRFSIPCSTLKTWIDEKDKRGRYTKYPEEDWAPVVKLMPFKTNKALSSLFPMSTSAIATRRARLGIHRTKSNCPGIQRILDKHTADREKQGLLTGWTRTSELALHIKRYPYAPRL